MKYAPHLLRIPRADIFYCDSKYSQDYLISKTVILYFNLIVQHGWDIHE